jgi:hypothetical protein
MQIVLIELKNSYLRIRINLIYSSLIQDLYPKTCTTEPSVVYMLIRVPVFGMVCQFDITSLIKLDAIINQ